MGHPVSSPLSSLLPCPTSHYSHTSLHRDQHGQKATHPCLGMETASASVVTDVEVTTQPPGVNRPASLAATFGHLVPPSLRVTTCMLATLSTVETGNRRYQAGPAKAWVRGTTKDLDRGTKQDTYRATTQDMARGTTQAIPATPCSLVVDAAQEDAATPTVDTRPCLHRVHTACRLAGWDVEQEDVETQLEML